MIINKAYDMPPGHFFDLRYAASSLRVIMHGALAFHYFTPYFDEIEGLASRQGFAHCYRLPTYTFLHAPLLY